MSNKRSKFDGENSTISAASVDINESTSDTTTASKTKFPKNNKQGNKSGKKFNSKGKSGKPKSYTGFEHTNDPAWRMQNPALSSTVGSILFSAPQGEFYSFTTKIGNQDTLSNLESLPTSGVMIFETVPLWGEGNSATSPMSIVGQKIQWLANVKWYSAVGYTPSDIIMMIMAVDSVHIMLEEAIRAYALSAQYSTQNKYFGKALVDALGFDYDDILEHLAEFRYQINQAITKINQIHIPNVFYVIDSHRNMYSRIFKEAPTSTGKEQLYAFRSNCFWRYNDSTGVMQCYPWKFSKNGTLYTKVTVELWAQEVSAMIDDILSSEFIAKMDADMLRIFPYSEIMHFDYIGEMLGLEFAYDPYILTQIFNMEFMAAKVTENGSQTTGTARGYSTNDNIAENQLLQQPLPLAFFQYTSKYKERTDLIGHTFKVTMPFTSTSARTQAQRNAQLSLLPLHSISVNAQHYFNILSIVPKEPGIILESAHFKFHLEQDSNSTTSDGYSNGSNPQIYNVTDIQDAVVTGVAVLTLGQSKEPELTPILPYYEYSVSEKFSAGAFAFFEGMFKGISALWQFSMPPMTFIGMANGNTDFMSRGLAEIQDMYLANATELKRMNYVSIQSMWDTNRLPESRSGGASMR